MSTAHSSGGITAPAAASAPAPALSAATSSGSGGGGSAESLSLDAAASPPPPSKGLLLRVKRKRNEAPLDTLLVTSSRAEKRAAIDDLRAAFSKGAALQHPQDAALPAAAAAAAAPTADATAAAVAASPTSASGSSTLFRPKAGAGALAPHARVFKLLTTISTPKEQHGQNDKILQRIAQLRHHRLQSHPSLASPSTEEVHQKRMVAQQLSSHEKRQVLLEHNRQRLEALAAAHPPLKQTGLLHQSEDVVVKIVDIKLPSSAPAAAASGARTTFQPPPLSASASAAAAKSHRKSQRHAESLVEGSSHRSIASSSVVSASTASSRHSVADAAQAAVQFTKAMASIKQMPQIGRAQMDAYKGLLEDYLSTLPPVPGQAEREQKEREETAARARQEQIEKEQRDQVRLADGQLQEDEEAKESAEEATVRPQSPFQNQIAPKIPLRRRKKPDAAAAATPAASAPAAVPTDQAIPFVSTSDVALPSRIFAGKEEFVAGGVAYDPRLLVPATGTSLHAAGRDPAARADLAAAGLEEAGGDIAEEESEYVYDVYHLEDDEAARQMQMQLPAGDEHRTAANHIHGSTTSVPLGQVLPGSDDYKARYDGASSAYVVLKDGLLEWVGGDELVHEDALALADDGDIDPDQETDDEMSDYPEEEDSSAEEEHEDQMRWAPDDDPDNQPYRRDDDDQPDGLSSYHPHHSHSLLHLRKTAQRPHGFYPEGPDEDADEEDDDHIVKEVRRSMRAGRAELSSSDDEEGAHYNPQLRPDEAQDDEDYTDVIRAEEDMDDERDEQGYE